MRLRDIWITPAYVSGRTRVAVLIPLRISSGLSAGRSQAMPGASMPKHGKPLYKEESPKEKKKKKSSFCLQVWISQALNTP